MYLPNEIILYIIEYDTNPIYRCLNTRYRELYDTICFKDDSHMVKCCNNGYLEAYKYLMTKLEYPLTRIRMYYHLSTVICHGFIDFTIYLIDTYNIVYTPSCCSLCHFHHELTLDYMILSIDITDNISRCLQLFLKDNYMSFMRLLSSRRCSISTIISHSIKQIHKKKRKSIRQRRLSIT